MRQYGTAKSLVAKQPSSVRAALLHKTGLDTFNAYHQTIVDSNNNVWLMSQWTRVLNPGPSAAD
ncbi:MAG: hypothetical protein ACI80V_002700 [Rhodothermales bacterium]|jgi:hypothetical protein